MINVSVASDALIALEFPRRTRLFVAHAVPGVAALALSALAAVWIIQRLPPPAAVPAIVRAPTAPVAAAPKPAAVVSAYGGLFDPGFFASPGRFAPTAPPSAPSASASAPAEPAAAAIPRAAPPVTASLAEMTPLPPPRPIESAEPPPPPSSPVRHAAPGSRDAAAPAPPPPDNRNFFEKLFGSAKQSGPALAYATAESGLFGAAAGPSSRYDRFTAVYDLTAHVVYLPNGTKLEAHSGLGDRLDDPQHVNERDRGATPPHLYELEAREQLFHGVQALRLNPVGGGDIFGRAGLLAHSYMLGPNGDSNGCVSFRDYDAFLRAYQTGQVKRLAVVARLD